MGLHRGLVVAGREPPDQRRPRGRVVDQAEPVVRSTGNPLALAQLLASRGLVEHAEGRDARATLLEAERLAEGTLPASDTMRRLAELRRVLGERPSG